MRKIKNIFHLLESVLASIVYYFPKNSLTVVGVTGTDGKTTTSSLIHHILESSGKPAGILSTLSSAHATTPGRGAVQKFLRRVYDEGKKYGVLEVTSIAVDQFRVWGVRFSIGVLTNIADHEHLDYHGSFENYRNTKIKFLLSCPVIVANADDPSFAVLKSRITWQKLISYAVNGKADVTTQSFNIKTTLLGEFNLYNILAAGAVCSELGISQTQIEKAISTFSAPSGRLEIVASNPVTVIVDFAHTPQAFLNVLPVAAKFKKSPHSKLIHVFGATGDRDKGKRPLMAKIAAEYDDYVILTHEDTYSEDPEKIISQLEDGISRTGFKKYEKIYSREVAVNRAVALSKPGDVIILTGVGHQKSMNVGGREIPWSEKETVLKALKDAAKK